MSDEKAASMTVHEQAAAALLDPYLSDPLGEVADGWHLIDNADPDDVRHALQVAIERMRAVRDLRKQNDWGFWYAAYDDAIVKALRTLRGQS